MSKIEKELNCNFDELLQHIENGILNGSLSATLEDSSDFIQENGRCSVRVFERYSAFGNNRVSLNVTLFQSDNNPIQLSAITSAVFFKINTLGEDAFLDCLISVLNQK